MSHYKIECEDCHQPITHMCDENFKEALIRFLSWVPEGMWSSEQMAEAFAKESKDQGDEYDFSKSPFFGSQAWSYLIWYKEDARSFHGVIDNMIRAAGLDPYQIKSDLYKKREEEEKAHQEEMDRRKRVSEERAKRKALKQNE
jgi:hypothetical protein